MNPLSPRPPRRALLGAAFLLAALLLPVLAFAQDEALSPRLQAHKAEADRKAEFFRQLMIAGRPTSNMDLYDVKHYDVDIDLDPTTELVSGTVTMTAEVTGASLDEADLDLLDNMTVSGATSGGSATTWSHASDVVTVDLDRTYSNGETFVLSVDYSGTPAASWGGFGFDTYDGEDMIWSLSEPYGARTWWPCKDVVGDKADSVDLRYRVPDDLIVAANGVLLSVDSLTTPGKKTYHWHEGHPISSYLVSVTAYPYLVYSDWYVYGANDSMEIQNFIFPGSAGTVPSYTALTPSMIAFMDSVYGAYPFLDEKYGHAEFLWGGAMEHQTCTSMGFWGEDVVLHELSHQWWGDMISPISWNHIWLNEGFAVYSEALWKEYKYGMGEYRAAMNETKYLGPGSVYCYDTSDPNRVMSLDLTYNKANWVLHMLRHVVGNETFFDITRAYYADPAVQYGNAHTDDLQRVAETVSGMDLDDFFDQWVYDEWYPIYTFEWSYEPAAVGYDLTVTIEQKQTNRVFKMPVDVWVEMPTANNTYVVQDTLATQTFVLNVPEEPTNVKLDKLNGGWILKVIQEPVTAPTFDRGILVVNGVRWDSYGAEITSAYEDSAFWGDFDISFWDYWTEPGGGYPSTLPAALGHGAIPADTLKQFSTVIWVGNNYLGDLDGWMNTSILDYLQAGGNAILLTRMGDDFFHPGFWDYLGVSWMGDTEATLYNYVSQHPSLANQSFTSTQSFCSLFDTSFSQGETELLFTSNSSTGNYGTGAYRAPAGGGTHRVNGGRFAFLSGRPYRMNHADLRGNMEYMLEHFFLEPFDPTGVEEGGPAPARFALERNRPNPFNPVTTIRFTVPKRSHVDLKVYETSGRLVRTLASGEYGEGAHAVLWDGRNDTGRSVGSGVYFYRMEAGDFVSKKKMVLIR
ncbi:MAG: T9SS type A sorting domain-containing protein [Candidatus Eisenbacteria bacterium]|nr:T9SS type A sorting domain-containing protein [Candidatus Eisenbacteria bacterium]